MAPQHHLHHHHHRTAAGRKFSLLVLTFLALALLVVSYTYSLAWRHTSLSSGNSNNGNNNPRTITGGGTSPDLDSSSLSTLRHHAVPLPPGQQRRTTNDATTTTKALTRPLDSTAAAPSKAVTLPSSTTALRLPLVLAMYFPQFHPDPLNDRIWKTNFTDWWSLNGAPTHNRYGQRIPRPTELGFYDLRDPIIRQQQGALAKQYDVDGFVVHHYWFYDKRHPGPTLHAPISRMLEDGHPNRRFFFNWCNEEWNNVWMGQKLFNAQPAGRHKRKILQKQFYNVGNHRIVEHYKWLAQFFHHPNYIRIENQPVFMVYQHDDQMNHILEHLRVLAIQDGFPGLYFLAGRKGTHAALFPLNVSALDAHSQSEIARLTQPLDHFPRHLYNNTAAYPYSYGWLNRTLSLPDWCSRGAQSSSPSVPQEAMSFESLEVPGVVTAFDNTPRRGYYNATIWNANLEPAEVVQRFEESLTAALRYEACCVDRKPIGDGDRGDGGGRGMVFVNAWNEWAEAMSLEPSDVYGRQLLEAVSRAKRRVRQQGCPSSPLASSA